MAGTSSRGDSPEAMQAHASPRAILNDEGAPPRYPTQHDRQYVTMSDPGGPESGEVEEGELPDAPNPQVHHVRSE